MPSAPTSINVSAPNCTSRVISWVAPNDAAGGNLITTRGPVNQVVSLPMTAYPGESIEPFVVAVIPGVTYQWLGGANEATVTINGADEDGSEDFTFVSTTDQVVIGYEPLQAVTASLKSFSDVQAFRLYRDDVLLQEFPAGVTSFTDTVTTTPHSYSVSTVDSNGGESTRVTWNSPAWQRHLWGTGDQTIVAIALDSSDNVYPLIAFSGPMDLGTGTIRPTGTLAHAVAKYNSSGVIQWVTKIDGTAVALTCIDVDSSGNVCVGGRAESVNFGGGTLTSAHAQDAVIAKYNSSGVHQWSKIYGLVLPLPPPTAGYIDNIVSSKFTSDGQVVIGGYFIGQITFDNGATYLGTPFGGRLPFVAKLSSAGAHVWSKTFEATADHALSGLDLDSSNNILLAVSGGGTINFGGGNVDGGNGVKIAKLNTNGGHLWSHNYAASQTVDFACVDTAGDLIVTAKSSSGTGNAGGGGIPGYGSFYNFFVAKYSGANGDFVWAKGLGSIGTTFLTGLSSDVADNVLLIGLCPDKEIQFGPPGGGVFLPPSTGFAVMYDSDGNIVWKESYGGKLSAINAASDEFPIVGGNFNSQQITIGWQTFTNQGTTDSFLQKRNKCP